MKQEPRERGEFAYGDPRLTRNSDEHPEQAYRRGYQQGAHAVLRGLREANVFDERMLQQLREFVARICDWRYARRRTLERHVLKDRAPMLELHTNALASGKRRRRLATHTEGVLRKNPAALI
jgi:hypothetical protein